MFLYLDTPGFRMGRKSGRIVVYLHDGSRREVPVVRLDAVVVGARGSISSDAVRLLSMNGIPVVFASRFSPYAVVHPFFMHGTVITRREQMLSYSDNRGVHLAKAFCYAATMNKARVLMYLAKSRGVVEFREISKRIEEIANEIMGVEGELDDIRLRLMGLEGNAARMYFDALRSVFPEWTGFVGRDYRPPTDPVNSLLSYGYVVLNAICCLAIAKCGLEPFAGFLHCDRSGKPSLVLDLSEEFRQPIVDIIAIRLFSKGMLSEGHFVFGDDGFVYLNREGKAVFFEALSKRLRKRVKDPYGSPVAFKGAIMRQARNIARFVLGVIPSYKPFVWRWW